jgi:hypothetical protein
MKDFSKVTSYPHFFTELGVKLVAVGDDNIYTLKEYKIAVKAGKKKCVRCGHTQNDHYGGCTYTKKMMACMCPGFREKQ